MEEKNGFYLNVGNGKKVFIERKNDLKEEDNKLLEDFKKNKDKGHYGIVNINGYIITYTHMINADKVYYFNMELANGKYKHRILDLINGAILNGYDIKKYFDMFERYSFSYKLVEYDNINIVYVFNDKYKSIFEDNNKYEDLD